MRLESCSYETIFYEAVSQRPPAEWARCWDLHEFYHEPNEAEDEPQPSFEDIKTRLNGVGIDTDFRTDLRDLKILACIAGGMNKTLVTNLEEMQEGELKRVIVQTLDQLEARKVLGARKTKSDPAPLTQEMWIGWEKRHQWAYLREKDNDFDLGTEMRSLVIRLKVESGHGSDM